jgi:GNAT superfamily N-acetyltransferase
VSSTRTVAIRPVRPEDVPAVVAMVYELADFEQLRHECQLTGEQLHESLFAPGAALFGHVAVTADTTDGPAELVGVALWFLNYSTWEGVHGIYLEDLYVRPHARKSGAGRALIAALAQVCVERGYQRLDFAVLHWNPARDFYHRIGAEAMQAWIPYRLTGAPLRDLAGTAS